MSLILRCWRILARAVGEGDYERYSEHVLRKHPGQPVLSAREFYLSRLREKYSRISRCC